MEKISITPFAKNKGVQNLGYADKPVLENNCYERKLGSANLPSEYG
jgi:hypothetical protein